MKRFSKKLVACLFLVVLLFSFLNITSVKAQSDIDPLTGKPSSGVTSNYTPPEGGYKDPSMMDFLKGVVNTGTGILAFPGFVVWQGIFGMVNVILSGVLALAATLFDFSIRISIEKFSNLIGPQSPLTQLWGLIRDTINIVLIFVLLYIAIAKIIGSLGIKAKSTFRDVILSALFINFSMFITRVVIDIGNMFAVAFYNQIIANGDSIAWQIAKQMNFITSIQDWSFDATGQGNALTIQGLQIVMIGTLIWAFVSVSMLFIGRAVMLIFLIITSPIGFVGSSIPWINDKAKEWKEALFDQVLVAPIFIFLLMIVLKAIKLLPELTGGAMTDKDKINPMAYFGYLFIIILLVKSVNITKKYSGDVAKAMSTAVKVVGTAALVAATGGVAMAGGAIAGIGGIAGRVATSTGFAGTAVGRGASRLALKAGTLTAPLKRVTGAITNTSRELVTGRTANGRRLSDDKSFWKGTVLSSLRTKSLDTIKKSTDGKVDIAGLEKKWDEKKKKSEKDIKEEAEKIGPQKEIDRAKQIDNTKENISQQATSRMKNRGVSFHKDKNNDEIEDLDKLIGIEKEIEKIENKKLELQRKEVSFNAAGEVSEAKRIRDEISLNKKLENTLETEKNDLKQAMDKYLKVGTDNIDHIKDSLVREKDEVAQEMGIKFDDLDTELETLKENIVKKTQDRNDFINSLTEDRGVFTDVNRFVDIGLYNKKDAQKIANELRAQKGKYEPEGDVLKRIKKAMGLKDDDENKPAAPKPAQNPAPAPKP